MVDMDGREILNYTETMEDFSNTISKQMVEKNLTTGEPARLFVVQKLDEMSRYVFYNQDQSGSTKDQIKKLVFNWINHENRTNL